MPAQQPAAFRAAVEANLQTLRVDALALVNLRLMSAEARAGIPMAEQLGELKALQDEGKIESIGLSNATVDDIAAREMVDLGEIQNAYNVMLRDDEDALRFCADRGIAYVPFFPLGSSFAGTAISATPDVRGVAERLEDPAAKREISQAPQ